MDSESIEDIAARFRPQVEVGVGEISGHTINRGATGMLKAHRASLKVHSKAAVDLTRGNGQEPEGYGSASGLSGGPSQAEAVTFGGDAEDEKDSTARSHLAKMVTQDLKAVYDRFNHEDEVKVAREMRFGLRLIVITLNDSILAGGRERAEFQTGVVLAVDPSATGVENVRFLAARAIRNAIEGVDWRLDAIDDDGGRLPAEEQPANIALRQILAGIRVMNHRLNAILQEDGTEEVHFDEPIESDEDTGASSASGDDEAVVAAPGTITATAQQPAPAGGSSGALQARPQQQHGQRIRWTPAEDLILVGACRANRGSTLVTIMNHHNQQMRADRQSAGAIVHRDRQRSAVEARRKHLRRNPAYQDI